MDYKENPPLTIIDITEINSLVSDLIYVIGLRELAESAVQRIEESFLDDLDDDKERIDNIKQLRFSVLQVNQMIEDLNKALDYPRKY